MPEGFGRPGNDDSGRRPGRLPAASQRPGFTGNLDTLGRVIERTTIEDQTEGGVAARVPALLDERLQVVGRNAPVTVEPGTTLRDCLAAIRRSGTGDSVFVVDADGGLLGVLTERDIFGRLVGGDVPPIDLDHPVETLMTTDPKHLHLEDTVRTAIELMQTGRYRNVPLVDDANTLQGVIRPLDVLKYLAEAFPEELLNLPPRPHQLMDRAEGG
jgi:CBS domain-containing protein